MASSFCPFLCFCSFVIYFVGGGGGGGFEWVGIQSFVQCSPYPKLFHRAKPLIRKERIAAATTIQGCRHSEN